MAYALGLRAVLRLCVEQDPLRWQRAKLSPTLFKPYEQPTFEWVQGHLQQHHVLPQAATLVAAFPDLASIEVPEPSSYYLGLLEQQYYYDTLNSANLLSQTILKDDQNAHDKAVEALRSAIRLITEQRYRTSIVDVAKDAAAMVLMAYHQVSLAESLAMFGWPYLDLQSGGVMPGDVISFVGRPAVGKTWLTLWTAMHNWMARNLNVLFVSMEMTTLPIVQRIAALYTHQNIGQLKTASYSQPTFMKFYKSLQLMAHEKAKLYVVDGNLASTVDDLFELAAMLSCPVIIIDGAYLLRHRNARLDRFTRAAENVELLKRYCTDANSMVFCSWQFNREATKKQKKGKGDDKGDLEDIGYSDAIGQISSIVLSMYQEDGVETMKARKVQVLKGRNGEVGQFSIGWDFTNMSFVQVDPPLTPEVNDEPQELQWV